MKTSTLLIYVIWLTIGQGYARELTPPELKTAGKRGVLALPKSPMATTAIVTTGTVWQYMVRANDPASTWKSDPGFSDPSAPWNSGPSPLGYGGQGPGGTLVTAEGGTCVDQCLSTPPATPSCKTCPARAITNYFRKTVSLTNVAGSTFTLRYQRDDGIVIYINGEEVARDNLSGPVSYTTFATPIPNDDEELAWKTADPALVASKLVNGTNLITAEVHQYSTTGSDMRFNMELLQSGPSSVTITRGPYLQMGTRTAATIRWRTSIPAVGKVTYGLSATSLTAGAVTEPTSTTEHEVRLTGLTEDKAYFYSVGTTSQILEQGPNNYFMTAPPPDSKRKIRIASFGDCGNNITTNQAYVRDAFLNFRSNNPIDLWMLTGDNAYDGYDHVYQTNLFDPYRDNLMKNCMLFPIPGNHDYLARDSINHNIPYYSVFTLPQNAESGGVASNSKSYYSVDYGPIHFVMLDTYGTSLYNGTQRRFYEDTTLFHAQVDWLKRDLAATTQKWKIVYMHHPPYTRGTHDSETEYDLIKIRQYINPILERFGVDLVMTGHDHVYERSYPLHNHYGSISTYNAATHRFPGDESSGKYDGSANSCPYKNTSEKKQQGTVYVVSGSAGALEYHQVVAKMLGKHPVMVGDVNTDDKNKGIGGSFYMEVQDNRLDAKFLQNVELVSGSYKMPPLDMIKPVVPGSYTIADQFTIMKDVEKVQTLTITAGQSATLTASFITDSPTDYQWRVLNNPPFASLRSVVVTPTTSQTYVVKDNKNCLQDIIVVQVNCTTTATISGALTVCSGQSTTLTASGGTSYLWNTGATTASISATAGTYSVTITSNGCSATATATVSASTCGPPDLTLQLYAQPTTHYGTTNFTVVVNVLELNSVSTNGLITVKITKESKVNLMFSPSLTSVGGRSVQNGAWTFSSSDPNYYVLTTTQSIAGGDVLSFGLNGVLTPGATAGGLSISAIVLGSNVGEEKFTNNTDADRIDYFQQ